MTTELASPVAVHVWQISTADLIPAAHNPARRERDIKDLVAALKVSGYMRPLDVTTGMVVIDGHRRLAAAKALGWESVPVMIHDEGNAGVLYAALNSAVMRPSGNDNLTVYLHNPEAVTAGARRGMARMEETLGRDLMQRLVDHGGSTATYKQAVQVANYCGVKDDVDWLRAIVAWLLETRQTYQVRRAIEDGIDARSLLRAVETKHAIRRGWEVTQ